MFSKTPTSFLRKEKEEMAITESKEGERKGQCSSN